MIPDLSIILPSYRSADLAHKSVVVLAGYLESLSTSWEIIVVKEARAALAHATAESTPRIHNAAG